MASYGSVEFDAGLQPSDIQFDATGYEHLSDVQQLQVDQWRAVWRTSAGPGAQLWAMNPAETLTLAAAAPYNPASETMSLVIRRTQTKTALFASVIEPFAMEPAIKQAQWAISDAGLSVMLDGDDIAATWNIHLDTAEAAFLSGKSLGRMIYDCRM